MGKFNSIPPQMFDHPLWAASRTFTNIEAMALLPQVRACDPAAIESMTTGYMRLALIIVGQYVALFKSRRWVDDFVSAAMEGLVEGVCKLRSPHVGVDNPKSIVSASVHRAITNLIENSPTIKMPSRTARRHGKVAPIRIYDDETNETIIESGPSPDVTSVEDAIGQVIETDLEAEIVRLRIEGYTDSEIGERLGYSQQTVQVIRQDLYDRLKTILPERNTCHD